MVVRRGSTVASIWCEYAWIFVCIRLLQEENSFSRANLEENCQLQGTDHSQGQICNHNFKGKWGLLHLSSKFIFYKLKNKKLHSVVHIHSSGILWRENWWARENIKERVLQFCACLYYPGYTIWQKARSFCRYRSTDYVSWRKTKEIKDRKQNNSK